MSSQQMIASHPDVKGNFNAALAKCIDECFACAQICISCADACLAEASVTELRECIRLDLDCADLCYATGALASRRTGSNEAVLRGALEVCQLACATCAEECERHASMHEHCRICAESCRQCERACRAAIPTVATGKQAAASGRH